MLKFPMGWASTGPGPPRTAAAARAGPRLLQRRRAPGLRAMADLLARAGDRGPAGLGVEVGQGAPRVVRLEEVEVRVGGQGLPEVVARGVPVAEPALDQPGVEEEPGVARAELERLAHGLAGRLRLAVLVPIPRDRVGGRRVAAERLHARQAAQRLEDGAER